MLLLLRLTDIARERGVSVTRASQLVRGIEPAAVTPNGARLYDVSTLEALRKRRERALQKTDSDPVTTGVGIHNQRPDLGRAARTRTAKEADLTRPSRDATVEVHRDACIP